MIEGGSGVGFAFGCNMLMGRNIVWSQCRKGNKKRLREDGKALILLQGIRMVIAAVEFYADGKVVALCSAAKR